MKFGEKLKKARMDAGMTQEELADVLIVSRAAVAKWESDRGLPDLSNLKGIANVLHVSVDSLLDEENALDLSVTRKMIDLSSYSKKDKLGRIEKIDIKERILRETYPNAEIIRLTVTKIEDTKSEKWADRIIGWFALLLAGLPLFGTQEFGKMVEEIGRQYYLVNEGAKQLFVLLTDEQMIVRVLREPVTGQKFQMGEKHFLRVGTVEKCEK